jgi:hypothetical protein
MAERPKLLMFPVEGAPKYLPRAAINRCVADAGSSGIKLQFFANHGQSIH